MADIPANLAATLDPTLPVALVPVRLETRFGTRTETPPADAADTTPFDVPVLRIRIYPDEISVVTSSPGLNAVEQQAGEEFWATPADSPGAPPGTAAWEVLVRRVGRERAAFVADATRPGGAHDAPAAADRTPATARLLPDSWVVVGHRDGQRVLAAHVPNVPASLQVGPSRASGADSFDPKDPNVVAAGELRWLTDFDEAERIGMAVAVDLVTPAQIAARQIPAIGDYRLDTLAVFGVREPTADRTGASEAEALADLLSAHAASDRVAFLPQGAATNNVDGRPSAFTSVPDIFAAYARVVGQGAAPAPATGVDVLRGGGDRATTAATALGLAPDVLAGLDGASALEQWPARAMARVLFPVTIGEVLGTLSLPGKASDDDYQRMLDRLDDLIPFASEHVASFVRSRGPLPTLRVGRQPYGVLPILPLQRWNVRAGEPAELSNLVSLLGVLRPFWEHAAAGLPHLDGSAPDLLHATDTLVRILGLGPVPHPGAYQVRTVTGEVGTLVYSPTRQSFVPVGVSVGAALGEDRVRDAVSADVRLVGYRALLAMTLPGLVRDTHFEAMQLQGAKPLRVSVARSDASNTGYETPSTYLRRLTSTFDLGRFRFLLDNAETKPNDLLFVLAEHALALSGELDSILLLHHAAKAAATNVVSTSPELLTSGLSVAATAFAAFSTPISEVRLQADAPVSAVLGGNSAFAVIGDDHLIDRARDEFNLPKTHLDGFPGTRAAINTLADAHLDDADYTRLVGEALSCCTNRLDAWITSIATQRLADLRAAQPTGLQLGSWGLLVDVHPANTQLATVPAGWDPAIDDGVSGAAVSRGPLLAPPPERQVGYVHAPSLGQARTAGVLRAGELSHRGDGSTLASLDLTSRRARIARDIIDAIANGQPLGALLGYRLERSLGDFGLHDAVSAFRAAFPQRRAAGDAGAPAGADDVVPPEVLDGLDAWRAGAPAVTALCNVTTSPGKENLATALADLDTAVEAVADVLVAEGVHHITSGRAEAAGATFAAIAAGSHPPLDLDVLREPRSGTTITHRLVLLLDETGGEAGWDRDRPRAALAPVVERWVEGVLGAPGRWRFAASGQDPAGQPIAAAAGGTTLADLGPLCALDVIVEADAAGGSLSMLQQRIAAQAGVASALVIEAAGDGPSWDALVALTAAVREVLAAARPAVPADLDPGPQEAKADAGVVKGVAGPTIEALEGIARRVADALDALADGVDAVAAAADDAPVGPLLAPFAALGLAGSVALAPGPAEAQSAAASARALLTDVDRVIDATVAGLVASGALAAPDGTRRARLLQLCRAARAVDILVDLARRTAGTAVIPLPEVRSALVDNVLHGTARTPKDAEVEAWLGRVARVRGGMSAYDDLRLFVEATGRELEPLTVAQLPLVDGESWLAGPLTRDDDAVNQLRPWVRPKGPRAHVVVAGKRALTGEATVRGLVLDEYVEVLPDPTVTTGLALHYDAPNARPPQSVLLALHPDPSQPWGWEILEETVLEALALARLRLVELDDLASTALDEYVPLTYLRDGIADTTPVEELTKGLDWTMVMLSATRYLLEAQG